MMHGQNHIKFTYTEVYLNGINCLLLISLIAVQEIIYPCSFSTYISHIKKLLSSVL